MRGFKGFLALLVPLMISHDALACGESLYRVGKGVLYREYTAPLPGKILIVARTEPELLMAERIAAAGHDVHVVSQPDQLGEEMASSDHEFDLVLAYFSQRAEVETLTASTSVSYLPVVQGASEKTEAATIYGRYVPDQASVKQFLKSIHSALRARI